MGRRTAVSVREKLAQGGFERTMRHAVESAGEVNMATLTFTAVLHREGDLYVAECPEVGTVSQGSTVEDALTNLKEATELYLEEFPISKVERPLITTFDAVVRG
jgi:predicted RNase H-like HicB family nuclease